MLKQLPDREIQGVEGPDFYAIAHQRVSVTPLQIDLTQYSQLDAVRGWLAAEGSLRSPVKGTPPDAHPAGGLGAGSGVPAGGVNSAPASAGSGLPTFGAPLAGGGAA